MNPIIQNELQDKIITWAESGEGDFSAYDVDREFDLVEADQKELRFNTLEGLVSINSLQRVGSRRGWYRRIDRSLNVIDWRSAKTEEFNIRLPFHLHEQVRIFPKSLVAISGEKNTGKTSICLNIVKDNQNRGVPIYYFSSEMLAPEFKVRLQEFDEVPVGDWNFTPVHRTSDFADVIQPDAINIVDFLEIYDKFWMIGKYMTDIFNVLNNGIAIVCVQKSGSAEHGRGGTFLIEKPRLTINLSRRFNEFAELDGAVLHVTNCKFPRMPKNPNGKMIDYYIRGGAQLQATSEWYYPRKQEG